MKYKVLNLTYSLFVSFIYSTNIYWLPCDTHCYRPYSSYFNYFALSVLQKFFIYSVNSSWNFLPRLLSIKSFWDLTRISLNMPPQLQTAWGSLVMFLEITALHLLKFAFYFGALIYLTFCLSWSMVEFFFF